MFKFSTFYRDDIWLGRYCGHPLTAWTHLAAALGIAVLLHQTPAVDIGWMWLLLLLVPGVWLFITGMFGMMRFTAKICGLESKDVFSSGGRSWRALLFSREGASAALMFVLLWSILGWQQQRPFDQEDFRRCVRILDPSAQAVLAKTAKPAMPRSDFWAACVAAENANTPRPSAPASLEELQAKSH